MHIYITYINVFIFKNIPYISTFFYCCVYTDVCVLSSPKLYFGA